MYKLKQLTLLGGDIVCLYLGFFVALLIRYGNVNNIPEAISPMTVLFLFSAIIIFITGLYDIGNLKNQTDMYVKIFLAGSIWVIISVFFFYLNNKISISPKTILALTGLIGYGLIAIWRSLYNQLLSTSIWKAEIIFAGFTPETKELINHFISHPQLGYKITGIFSTETEKIENNIAVYNNSGNLPHFDIIIVSPKYESDLELTKNLYKNLFQHVQVETLANFYEKTMKRIPPFTLSETWFLTNLQEQNKKIYDRIKLIPDYILATIIFFFFVITFPIIAVLIRINSKGPIFYSQNRVGQNGVIFKLYKYRTMHALNSDGSAETSGPQYAQEKDKRITKIGKILRLARLDELPQIINVFKKDMALIGPRPERPEFVNELTQAMPFYSIRHLVKPGLTGWAQLKHDYYGTINENLRKLEYDLYYIKNRGPLLDLSIILHTINIILGLKGR